MVDEVEEGPRPRPRLEPAAWLALILLSAIWGWWAWQEGAYFGVVVLPGTVVLCAGAVLLLWFTPRQEGLRLPRVVVLAAAALAALGCWAVLSALWSPAGDIAIANGQRILMYALSFGLGVALCNQLGVRLNLSLVPLAAAAAFAGLITAVSLAAGGDPRDVLEIDGTLEFPLGYRNATAAFFAIALFPALGLASDRDRDWRLRGAGLATATLCIELVLLAQSRASMPAMLVALVVYTLCSPRRVRALAWLGLAVLPALLILPASLSLYSAADDGIRGVADEMNRAGVVALVSVLVSLAAGCVVARYERRSPEAEGNPRVANRRVAQGLVVLAVVAVVGFLAAVGDPVDWISARADEFRNTTTPDLSDRANRFTFNAGSQRYDAWRVALDDAGDDPLLGDGGGGYRYSYLVKRDNAEQYLHDAHSVELEILAELGIVGLGLFVVAIAAATAGMVRARRVSPPAAGLSAIALAAGSYWLVHTSVDWFWPYPAITAPVLALAGSACGPLLRRGEAGPSRSWRGPVIAGLVVLAISTIPPWLSERYTNSAFEEWRTDLARAYDDLDRAQRLNPLNDLPLLAEASIARATGDRERALVALRDAAELRPEEWAAHYLLAELQAESDPAVARAEIEAALARNPREPLVIELADELGVGPGPSEG